MSCKVFFMTSTLCGGISIDDAVSTYSQRLLEAFVALDGSGDFELVAYCNNDTIVSRLSYKTSHSTSDVLGRYRQLANDCDKVMVFDLSGLDDIKEHDRLKLLTNRDNPDVTYHFIAKNSRYIERFKTTREYRRVKDRGWVDECSKRVATYVTKSF